MLCTTSRQHGFTLLEILVTLAILAIVTALALPSMSGVLGNSELSATSNRLVHSLHAARSEAIKRISPVSLCPSQNPKAVEPVCDGIYTQGWIVFVDVNGNGARDDAGDTVISRNEALSSAFSVDADASFVSGVRFSISGVSVNAAGVPISGELSITHAANDDERLVKIAASGRISSSTPDIAAPGEAAS